MKCVIAAFLVVLAVGFASCGGSSTTTIQQAAPPPTTTTALPYSEADKADAEALVRVYDPSDYECQALTSIPYSVGFKNFRNGYDGTPGAGPPARAVFDALLDYCGGGPNA